MAVRILGFGYLPLRYDPVSNPVVYSILHNVCIVCLVGSSLCVPHQTELVSKYGALNTAYLLTEEKSVEKHRTFLYVTANIIDLVVLPLHCTVVKGRKSLVYSIFRLYLT